MEVFIHENRRHRTMLLCRETVEDNIWVNIGVNIIGTLAGLSDLYAMYGDSDSDSDRVRCFKCLASTDMRAWHVFLAF